MNTQSSPEQVRMNFLNTVSNAAPQLFEAHPQPPQSNDGMPLPVLKSLALDHLITNALSVESFYFNPEKKFPVHPLDSCVKSDESMFTWGLNRSFVQLMPRGVFYLFKALQLGEAIDPDIQAAEMIAARFTPGFAAKEVMQIGLDGVEFLPFEEIDLDTQKYIERTFVQSTDGLDVQAAATTVLTVGIGLVSGGQENDHERLRKVIDSQQAAMSLVSDSFNAAQRSFAESDYFGNQYFAEGNPDIASTMMFFRRALTPAGSTELAVESARYVANFMIGDNQ